MTLLLLALALAAPDAYTAHFQAAEEAKARGDYAGMEAGLLAALEHGPGNEYAWRSLAWAQMHQGKWRESLASARANLERHGATAWSLEQLAESAILAGDVALARESLERIAALPAEAIGSAAGAVDGTRRRLRQLTEPRTVDTEWEVDLTGHGAAERPVRLLIPKLESPRQRCEFAVREAVSWKLVTDGERDLIEVRQKPGEPFLVVGRVTLLPSYLGEARLEALPNTPPPAELAACLGPFQHGFTVDPAIPACAELAATLRGATPVATVRNVLAWFQANWVYDLEPNHGSLADMLAAKRGKCHFYCATFVALCRAAGVPAVVAHGVSLPAGPEPFSGEPGSHGWAEVWLPEVGWCPVEPLDPKSLAAFSAGRSYLWTDNANLTPDDTHFRFISIQGCRRVSGRYLAD